MSDKTEYHIGEGEETLKLFELRNAITCAGFLLPTLRALPPEFRLLEVGCGPASITFELARMFPHATIIGVDQSEPITKRNQDAMGKLGAGTGISFRAGNILRPESFLSPEEFGSFDVVFEHTTLIHIPDNVEALRQMRRAAKPAGGAVASRNGDIRAQVIYPPCAEYQRLIAAMYAHNGADIETGRKIIEKALSAGWRRGQISPSASTMMISTAAERAVFGQSMLDNLADKECEYYKTAVAIGYDDEGLQPVRDEMRRFMEAEAGWRLVICSEVLCRND